MPFAKDNTKPLLAAAATAVTLLVYAARGFAATGAAPRTLAMNVALATLFAALVGAAVRLRFRAWAVCMIVGIVLGMVSAAPLYFEAEAVGHDMAGLLTLAFFAALGISVGAVAEFIAYVHHLTHGRHPRQYPPVAPPSERDRLSI
jgi:hypothetical protein